MSPDQLLSETGVSALDKFSTDDIVRDITATLDRTEAVLLRLEARAATDPIRRAWRRAAAASGSEQARPPVGALAQWRRELAGGQRTRRMFDSVWRQACDEAAARERPR